MLGQECGGDLPANPSGEINNPDVDGDSKYDHNSECFWTITAEMNKVIEIQFYYIEMEGWNDLPCLYDYVQVSTFHLLYLSRDMTKPTMWHMRPTKTQISLSLIRVSLCAQWDGGGGGGGKLVVILVCMCGIQ